MTILNYKTREQALGSRTKAASEPVSHDWASVNWALAMLVAVAAVLVTVVVLAPVLDAPGCSTAACPSVGPHEFLFDVLYYGASAVGGLTLLASFFTATARHGIIVPLCGCALLVADVMAVTVIFGG